MAGPYYVDSAAAGTASGADWTNAFLTLGAAFAAATAAGDIIYVAQGHNEPAGSATYTFNAASVASNPIRVICADKTSGTPPTTAAVMTNALSGTTGSSVAFIVGGIGYMYGIKFTQTRTATGGADIQLGNNADNVVLEFEQCTFTLPNNTGSDLLIGADTTNNARVILRDCTIVSAHSGFQIEVYSCAFEWLGGSLSGTAPTTLFQSSTSREFSVFCQNVDLSVCTGTLVTDSSAFYSPIVFSGCVFGSGVALYSGGGSMAGTEVWAYNCGVGAVFWDLRHANARGELTTVAGTGSVIMNTADAAKYDGTNALAWKIVTTANCSFAHPYRTPWIDKMPTDTTTAITPRIECITNGQVGGSTRAHKDNEVWGEWQYPSSASTVASTLVSDRLAQAGLATAADQTAGAGLSAWDNEAANSTSYKLTPGSSFTPASKHYMRARVSVGLASQTLYVNPKICDT